MNISSSIATTISLIVVVNVSVSIVNTAFAQQKKSVWDGVYTEIQANRGATLYNENCAICHGPELAGADMSPGLVQGAFIYNWDGSTVGDLFQRIRNTMPLALPKSVPRKVKADILAFIMQKNNFPAGKQELSYKTRELHQITWDAQNPSP